MNEQEKAFWIWWEKIEPMREYYNLRQAFDAGYEAAEGAHNE